MEKKIFSQHLLLVLSAIFLFVQSYGQVGKSLAEKLGYPRNAKLLIIHADDAGVSHSENMATMAAFEKKGISSCSVMVPCPWFGEIAAYAKAHPELDFGIHITLTCEWENYRWDGVMPSDEIPSLINDNGHFYRSDKYVAEYADLKEVEKEVRAQIDRALAFGIKPTHLDSHVGSIFQTPALFKVYLNLGKEYHLPVFFPLNLLNQYPQLKEIIPAGIIYVNNVYAMTDETVPQIWSDKNWSDTYEKIIKSMKPGLNELIVHLAIDNDEMEAVTVEHHNYGAAWRQRDFNFVTSNAFKQMLKENKIIPVTWGQIKALMDK